jgi:hypothetical protein
LPAAVIGRGAAAADIENPMIWKFFLTIAVIIGGILFVMTRWREPVEVRTVPPPRPPLLPTGATRVAAYVVLGFMLIGTGWYLYAGWATGNTVMRVQVVNANTGAITLYQARRRDIAGRGFRTLDGRDVRLADVERMILEPAARQRLPAADASAPGR